MCQGDDTEMRFCNDIISNGESNMHLRVLLKIINLHGSFAFWIRNGLNKIITQVLIRCNTLGDTRTL